jgi:tRNA:m4X modification enzyme
MTEDKKRTDAVPPVPQGWTRCQFFLPAKQRFCRQLLLKDSIYCGNHQELSSSHAVLRVPCPLDPSHTVVASRVAQHLRKCPMAKRQREIREAAYYCKDINTGGYGQTGAGNESDAASRDAAWAERVALAVLKVHQQLFAGPELGNDAAASTLTLAEIHQALPLQDYSVGEFEAGLAQNIESHHIKSGGHKHLQQQGSLVGHLRRLGALPLLHPELDDKGQPVSKKARVRVPSVSSTFLEMGAGRGMLGLVAAGVSAVSQPTRLVLVERGGSRSKADTVLRNWEDTDNQSYMNLVDVSWSRIQCDLAHVNMIDVAPGSEGKEKEAVHVIAKHLCGAGTDLALKSLLPIRKQVSTCLLATCCHGVCTWEAYVGRDFLQAAFLSQGLTFGRAEFELLRRWSSGTVLSLSTAATEGTTVETATAEEHPAAVLEEEEKGDDRVPHAIGRVVESLHLVCGVQGIGRCCQRM